MIVTIEGRVAEVSPIKVVIETANGMGYEVNVPISTTEKIPPIGKTVKLHTFAVYREDAQSLYGFHCREDRDFFRLLIEKVSGVGPKVALGILSKLSVNTLKNAIVRGDTRLLAECPGIGKKTAERLVLELKDKVFPGGMGGAALSDSGAIEFIEMNIPMDSPVQDAVAALVTLGYKLPDADKAIQKALKLVGEGYSTEDLIKRALG